MPARSNLNFRDPDYGPVFGDRLAALERLRADTSLIGPLKLYYKDHPADFISDWGMTFDPRMAEIGKATTIPFCLFPKQEQFISWLHQRWLDRDDGLAEKCRDMGVSWLCVAFAVWMWLFHPGTVVGFGSRKEEYVDKLGDPKSLFWKVRQFVNLLPIELQPRGWDETKHAPSMRIMNPENDSVIVGEAGDNIGRGNRTSIYFKDESAFYERADAIDAALSMTSNCKIDVSTPNGAGNPFYRKRHGGKVKVFIFDWRDDPRKSQEWYDQQCEKLDPVIVAQEIDRNYEASVADAFISGELVEAAQRRGPADVQPMGGLKVGIDVARFGDDKSVISFRRGRVLIKQSVVAKLDIMQVATWARNEIDMLGKPEQIAVDTIGLGAGVADIMRGWYPDVQVRNGIPRKIVVDVNSSIRMTNGQDYNLRSSMWREMREWLKTASMPKDPDMKADLTSLRYKYRGGEMLMEDKAEAKARGMKSPDRADSLALTFAIPVAPQAESAPVPAFQAYDPSMGMLG